MRVLLTVAGAIMIVAVLGMVGYGVTKGKRRHLAGFQGAHCLDVICGASALVKARFGTSVKCFSITEVMLSLECPNDARRVSRVGLQCNMRFRNLNGHEYEWWQTFCVGTILDTLAQP